MQSVNTRMRRAVEKENQDLDERRASSKKSKGKQRSRQKPNLCLPLIVLSPILVIGAFIIVAKQYATWSQAESEMENSAPLISDLTDYRVVSPVADLKRLRKARTEKDVSVRKTTKNKPKYLILKTKHGNIKITLRPDLSQGSVDYIYKLVESYGDSRCMHCNFYRAEKPGILQGIMENKNVVPVNTVLGSCPPGSENVANDCPEWDKKCGCHGPIMTRGAVAWAAGQAGGPDFFIDAYEKPANWWGTQHTNFGFIDDMSIIDSIFEFPTEEQGGMTYLKDSIHFDLALE